jgi:hypothetical protein
VRCVLVDVAKTQRQRRADGDDSNYLAAWTGRE